MPLSSSTKTLLVLLVLAGVAGVVQGAQAGLCSPTIVCNRDSMCPPGTWCMNNNCRCGEPVMPFCGTGCIARGYDNSQDPGDSTIHVSLTAGCRGARSIDTCGNPNSCFVQSYCFTAAPVCHPQTGQSCLGPPNACGNRATGVRQCNGTCRCAGPPTHTCAAADAAVCGSNPTGSFTSATCTTASGNATDADGSPVTVRIHEGGQIASGPATPAFAVPLTFAPITDGLPKLHTLRAYAVDVPSGTLVQLLSDQVATCQPPAPTVNISVAPTTVAYGGSTTVNWSVTNTVSCTASPPGWFNPAGIVNGVGAGSGGSGPLTADTQFTLTCLNGAGQLTAVQTNVTVTVPPPVGTVVSCTDTDYCTAGAGMNINWQYDSVARPISAYRIQVLDGGNNVVFDTNKTGYVALESEYERDVVTDAPKRTRPGISRMAGWLVAALSSFLR